MKLIFCAGRLVFFERLFIYELWLFINKLNTCLLPLEQLKCPEQNAFKIKPLFMVKAVKQIAINTQYMTNSTLVCPVKIECDTK